MKESKSDKNNLTKDPKFQAKLDKLERLINKIKNSQNFNEIKLALRDLKSMDISDLPPHLVFSISLGASESFVNKLQMIQNSEMENVFEEISGFEDYSPENEAAWNDLYKKTATKFFEVNEKGKESEKSVIKALKTGEYEAASAHIEEVEEVLPDILEMRKVAKEQIDRSKKRIDGLDQFLKDNKQLTDQQKIPLLKKQAKETLSLKDAEKALEETDKHVENIVEIARNIEEQQKSTGKYLVEAQEDLNNLEKKVGDMLKLIKATDQKEVYLKVGADVKHTEASKGFINNLKDKVSNFYKTTPNTSDRIFRPAPQTKVSDLEQPQVSTQKSTQKSKIKRTSREDVTKQAKEIGTNLKVGTIESYTTSHNTVKKIQKNTRQR